MFIINNKRINLLRIYQSTYLKFRKRIPCMQRDLRSSSLQPRICHNQSILCAVTIKLVGSDSGTREVLLGHVLAIRKILLPLFVF